MKRGRSSINLIDRENQEVSGETVIRWCKEAVCSYFRIDENTLGDSTRLHISSYPRKIFWYFARCNYGIANSYMTMIGGNGYDSATVSIQSETVLLQTHYNKDMKYDVDEIFKILKKKEALWDGE